MTSAEDKNIHIFHGDDGFSLNRKVKELLSGAGNATEIEMNTARLDGKQASFDEIVTAATTLPFFGGSRWIILDSALSKVDKSKVEKFQKLLAALPGTNQMVMLIEDHQRWRKDANGRWIQVWETLHEGHWLMEWAQAHISQTEVLPFALPDEKAMDGWVSAEVNRQGGKIEAEAARELSRHVGNETSIASQEIGKLLMYVNYARPITAKDVIEMVSDEGSADVFIMLDALVEGREKEAQSLLRRLLEEDPPEVILGAVSHRFRQLIQVREALDEHEDLKVLVDRKVIFNNQSAKYAGHARRFSMEKLKVLYKQLLDMDIQSKTSQIDLGANLELFLMEVAH
jgi:DNA polymerase-3 subunit delta